MRPTRLIAAAALGLFLAAMLALLIWSSRSPIELKLVRIEPSGMVDDNGNSPSLITLKVVTHNLLAVGWITVEARITNRWVKTDDRCWIGGFYPSGESHEEVLLTPSNADACRLHLTYEPCPFRWRLWLHLGARGQRFVRKFPFLDNWLELQPQAQYRAWSSALGQPRPPPHWRQAVPELRLPRSEPLTIPTILPLRSDGRGPR